MTFLGIAAWRWLAFYVECAAAAGAIGWWADNRKTIVLKRKKNDWED